MYVCVRPEMKQKGTAELDEHIWKFDHKNTFWDMHTTAKNKAHLIATGHGLTLPFFFSSGEGRSQPGLCPSVLCPFPPLTPQVLPPACSMSPLPRLPRSCADTDHFCLSLNLTAPVEHTKVCRCHLQNR